MHCSFKLSIRKNGWETVFWSMVIGSFIFPDITKLSPPAALKLFPRSFCTWRLSLDRRNVAVLRQLTSAPVSKRLLTVKFPIWDCAYGRFVDDLIALMEGYKARMVPCNKFLVGCLVGRYFAEERKTPDSSLKDCCRKFLGTTWLLDSWFSQHSLDHLVDRRSIQLFHPFLLPRGLQLL